LMFPFAMGVFAMLVLTVRFFGGVSILLYCAATVAMTVSLLLLGLPR